MSNDDPAYQQQRKSIPSVESNMRSSAEEISHRRSFNMNYQPSVDNDNSFSENDDLQTFRVDPSRHLDKDEVSTFGGDIKETSLDEMLLAGRSTMKVNLE